MASKRITKDEWFDGKVWELRFAPDNLRDLLRVRQALAMRAYRMTPPHSVRSRTSAGPDPTGTYPDGVRILTFQVVPPGVEPDPRAATRQPDIVDARPAP